MKILAVDVSSVCRTYWEIYQSGKLTDGEAFTRSVERIKRAADGFDRVVLALDVGPSFRKLHCPTYKSNRPDPGEAYRAMMRDVVGRLKKDGATSFPNAEEKAKIATSLPTSSDGSAPFYYPEADDVIASLQCWYLDTAFVEPTLTQLRILTGDTDLWALVSDAHGVTVETIQNGEVIFEAAVAERFGGVGRDWILELKALAGDRGDGYTPFMHPDPPSDGKEKPGIGKKTAIELLNVWGMWRPEDGADRYGFTTRSDTPSAACVALAAADGVSRGAIKGSDHELGMPDCHERRCMLAARGGGLRVGYACARMIDDLPLDFSRILAEPKIEAVAQATAVGGLSECGAWLGDRVKDAVAAATEPPRAKTALTRYAPRVDLLDPNALQPQTLSELFEVGRMVVNSRIYPAITTPERAMMVIAEARERRIPYATALRNAYFVRDRLAWSAAFISGLVLRSSVCAVFEISETTPEYAVVDYQRKGRNPGQFRFELAEAVKAGWTKVRPDSKGEPKWVTNPRVMLRWAALREAARAFFPDVVSGMYTPDELRDGRILDAEFEEMNEEKR